MNVKLKINNLEACVPEEDSKVNTRALVARTNCEVKKKQKQKHTHAILYYLHLIEATVTCW